ncbi:class I SAM-dependent methyltransferase [Pseudomonas sp. TE3610]
MEARPPGTILQLMYLKERLLLLKPGRFVEIGAGSGHISALLLALGWTGTAYDLEPTTIDALSKRFTAELADGRYSLINGDWLSEQCESAFDLVISCMVMEHFDEAREASFINRSKTALRPLGTIITIVPGSLNHWGIEDEIAGHYRRYTKQTVSDVFEKHGLKISHVAGLTFPLSNILLPLSNFLVRKNESQKLSMDMEERTRKSGIRGVPMKTTFPKALGLILNETVMYPLHYIQKLFSNSDRAMVIYSETRPK